MSVSRRSAAWSAAWGVVAVVVGAFAERAWAPALESGAGFPGWPAWMLATLTVLVLYASFACLTGAWPAAGSGGRKMAACISLVPEHVGYHLRLGLANHGPAAEFQAQVTVIRGPLGLPEPRLPFTIPLYEDHCVAPKMVLSGGTQVLDFAWYDAAAVDAEIDSGQGGISHWWFSAAPSPVGARYYNLRSRADLELQKFTLTVRVMNASTGGFVDLLLTVSVRDGQPSCAVEPLARAKRRGGLS